MLHSQTTAMYGHVLTRCVMIVLYTYVDTYDVHVQCTCTVDRVSFTHKKIRLNFSRCLIFVTKAYLTFLLFNVENILRV